MSDEAPETTDTGYLSDARNDGTVEGDVNVAGIVGSMAIEYDFDPEDDLIREGDRSWTSDIRPRQLSHPVSIQEQSPESRTTPAVLSV